MPDALPDLLYHSAQTHGDAPAIIGANGAITYRELDARVDVLAHALWKAGLQRGDRLALRLPPGPDYIALLWACLRLGVVACPLSPRLPADQLPESLHRLSSHYLVIDGSMDVGTDVQVLSPAALGDGTAASEPRPAAPIETKQPATLLFTSGSTGTPRLALHSYGNHYYSAQGAQVNMPLVPGDRWLLSLPLYHVGGLAILFRCALAGASVILADGSTHETLAQHRVSHASMVPTQLQRLLHKAPLDALHSLKAVLLGGGPVPDDLVEEAVERGVPLHTTYGLTEMSSQVTTTPPDARAEHLATAGRLLPHRDLALAHDGEILVRSRTLFLGYIEGDRLHLPVDGAGWFHTRDLGELTPDGYLRVTGRADNLFITGGENVQPEEIEQALARLPGVLEVVVVAVPDEVYGARPVAFVRTAYDEGANPTAWREALEHTLPRFKIPDAFHPWPSDDAGSGLKPDREALRRRATELQRGEQ